MFGGHNTGDVRQQVALASLNADNNLWLNSLSILHSALIWVANVRGWFWP